MSSQPVPKYAGAAGLGLHFENHCLPSVHAANAFNYCPSKVWGMFLVCLLSWSLMGLNIF